MIKQPAIKLHLAILVLFLCFGSQASLLVAGVPVTEILEADFDQFEPDEDLLATTLPRHRRA